MTNTNHMTKNCAIFVLSKLCLQVHNEFVIMLSSVRGGTCRHTLTWDAACLAAFVFLQCTKRAVLFSSSMFGIWVTN